LSRAARVTGLIEQQAQVGFALGQLAGERGIVCITPDESTLDFDGADVFLSRALGIGTRGVNQAEVVVGKC
jgi:hypothetical protein